MGQGRESLGRARGLMLTLYSIGHGNRDLEEFIALLRAADIQCLVDVRAYPRLRRNPQFASNALGPVLNKNGIRYVWEGQALGGMRRPRGDSPHSALADAAYRGFADHMASAEFQNAVQRLLVLGGGHITAFMCAETDPQHCHRSFIADALVVHGAGVFHLIGTRDIRQHTLRAGARLAEGGQLVYDSCVQLGLAL
jgi:uncharacterized protein (DUF488 family)